MTNPTNPYYQVKTQSASTSGGVGCGKCLTGFVLPALRNCLTSWNAKPPRGTSHMNRIILTKKEYRAIFWQSIKGALTDLCALLLGIGIGFIFGASACIDYLHEAQKLRSAFDAGARSTSNSIPEKGHQ